MPRIESDGRGFDTHGAYHEKARFNQKDYTHYVVVARGGVPFIESGWSYPEDAKDQLTNGNLPDGIKAKVVTKIGLKRAGVDPDDNKNWLRGQWWLETEPGRPGQKFSHGDVEIETTLHPVKGFGGVSPRTRLGTRVRFIGHSFGYSNPPEKGEEGIVTYMPGYKPKTYLPGPGGGLLYVKWDNLGVMGVSPNDVESVMPDEGRLNVGSYGSRGKRSGLGDSGKAISEHKIKDHGVEHEQYFQGCGISHSKWDEVASGVGSTPMEAYEDALDSLAQNGWDVESLPQDGEGLSKKSEIPPNEPIGYNPSGYSEDLHHYVCVYVKG